MPDASLARRIVVSYLHRKGRSIVLDRIRSDAHVGEGSGHDRFTRGLDFPARVALSGGIARPADR
jgi:hypothetical protein